MVSSTSRSADSVNSLVSSAAKAPEVCLREAAHPRRSVGVAQFAEVRRPAVYGRVERGRVGRRISGRRWARRRERCSALSRGPGGTAVVGRCSDDRWGTESALSSIRRILSVCVPGESPAGMSTWTSEVPDAKTAAQPSAGSTLPAPPCGRRRSATLRLRELSGHLRRHQSSDLLCLRSRTVLQPATGSPTAMSVASIRVSVQASADCHRRNSARIECCDAALDVLPRPRGPGWRWPPSFSTCLPTGSTTVGSDPPAGPTRPTRRR